MKITNQIKTLFLGLMVSATVFSCHEDTVVTPPPLAQ